jgi:hypothetical protein
MKAQWNLWTFSPRQITRALKSVNAKCYTKDSRWLPARGTLMTEDGVRTGQVALQRRTPIDVTPPVVWNPRDRVRVVSALTREKRTG